MSLKSSSEEVAKNFDWTCNRNLTIKNLLLCIVPDFDENRGINIRRKTNVNSTRFFKTSFSDC